MIKYNWNIDENEKNRILRLHETATKKLYLIKEQQDETAVFQNTEDDKFTFLIVQPETSDSVSPIDWTKDYYVVADDGENAYISNVVEKKENNYPLKFTVDYNRPVPRFSPENISQNEFKFQFKKVGKSTVEWIMNSDVKTTNSKLYGDEIASYYAVLSGDSISVAMVQSDGPYSNWGYSYEEMIDLSNLENGQTVEFVPMYHLIYSKGGYMGLTVPSTFNFYAIPRGKITTPTGGGGEKKIEPPPPMNFGDFFADNVSTLDEAKITGTTEFKGFSNFVNGNDVSGFTFTIQSSASGCRAGYVENDSSKGFWKDSKQEYKDVDISQANQKDVGNLNLTKARAQNLKTFLIQKFPKLSSAKFKLVALGSVGPIDEKGKIYCGKESDNKQYRKVNLTIQ